MQQQEQQQQQPMRRTESEHHDYVWLVSCGNDLLKYTHTIDIFLSRAHEYTYTKECNKEASDAS